MTPDLPEALQVALHSIDRLGERLDRGYLQQWATRLGVEDLLSRALGGD